MISKGFYFSANLKVEKNKSDRDFNPYFIPGIVLIVFCGTLSNQRKILSLD